VALRQHPKFIMSSTLSQFDMIDIIWDNRATELKNALQSGLDHSIAHKSKFSYKSMSYKRLDSFADSMRFSQKTSMKSMSYDHAGGADGALSKTCVQSDGLRCQCNY
jgi:hypothetical protein